MTEKRKCKTQNLNLIHIEGENYMLHTSVG